MRHPATRLIHLVVANGRCVSVDDGKKLVTYWSTSREDVLRSLKGKKDLLWIYEGEGPSKNKMGWISLNSTTGDVLDFSERDPRVAGFVGEEYARLVKRKK